MGNFKVHEEVSSCNIYSAL